MSKGRRNSSVQSMMISRAASRQPLQPRHRHPFPRPAATAAARVKVGSLRPERSPAVASLSLCSTATSIRRRSRAYYGQFEAKNHPEKILVFSMFLKEVLNMEKITGNDIFTCYTAMKSETKTPKAFAQALRDAEGKNFHYIEVKAWDDIIVPISGSNYFHHDLKKKAAE